MNEINVVMTSQADMTCYKNHFADVLIMRTDGSLYLQKHPDKSENHFGAVHIFGGHVEAGESYSDAAIREIKEETGGIINHEDLIYIGSVTEDFTNHSELVHIYFWHDKFDTITGCYERESIEFADAEEAMNHDKVMPYTKWAISQCLNKGLIF